MAQTAAKLRHIVAEEGATDSVAQTLDFLKDIVPGTAVHIVNIRRYEEAPQKFVVVVSPGTFHAMRGDLVYWSASSVSAELSFPTGVIGASKLIVPVNGTSRGSIQPSAADPPGTQHRYTVTVAGDIVITDDGTEPTIIVDD